MVRYRLVVKNIINIKRAVKMLGEDEEGDECKGGSMGCDANENE